MKQIDDYLNHIYKGLNSSEALESKKEMKLHIVEVVNELIRDGKSENEAVRIALNRFGGKEYLMGPLYSLFSGQKKLANNLLKTGITAFVLASIIAGLLIILDIKSFSNIDKNIPFTLLFNITNTLFILSGAVLLNSLGLYITHRIKCNRYRFI